MATNSSEQIYTPEQIKDYERISPWLPPSGPYTEQEVQLARIDVQISDLMGETLQNDGLLKFAAIDGLVLGLGVGLGGPIGGIAAGAIVGFSELARTKKNEIKALYLIDKALQLRRKS